MHFLIAVKTLSELFSMHRCPHLDLSTTAEPHSLRSKITAWTFSAHQRPKHALDIFSHAAPRLGPCQQNRSTFEVFQHRVPTPWTFSARHLLQNSRNTPWTFSRTPHLDSDLVNTAEVPSYFSAPHNLNVLGAAELLLTVLEDNSRRAYLH